MGERYDLTVDVRDGVFPVVAVFVGKSGYAKRRFFSPRAFARDPTRERAHDVPTHRRGSAGRPGCRPLHAAAAQVTHDLPWSGSMAPYVWTINGATYDVRRPRGHVRSEGMALRLANMSMMSHPIHLHGHTFQIGPGGDRQGPQGHHSAAPMARAGGGPGQDNPGAWMLHCHNAYPR